MSRAKKPIEAALDRWVEQGLLDPATAADCHDEAVSHRTAETSRRERYLVASVAAFILFVAAVLFAERTWPLLGVGARAVILVLTGAALYLLGTSLEVRRRWVPSAILLQTSGLALALVATVYSEVRWSDGTAGGIGWGVLALLAPLGAAYRIRERLPLTVAQHVAFAFPFVAVFLGRAVGLNEDDVVWALDGMVLVLLALLAWRLRSMNSEGQDALLAAVSTTLFGGLVLSIFTGLGPLDLDADAIWAADVWLGLTAAVTLWGIHRAPAALQRSWFESQLGACVLLAVPLLLFSTAGALEAAPEVTALVQAALGGGALWYGLRFDALTTFTAGVLGLAVGAWVYGLERAEALGAVAALAVAAGLLFWLSTRIRGRSA
jgi:hypothetical protein